MHVPDFDALRPSLVGPAHVLTSKDVTPERIAQAGAVALAVCGLGQTPPLAKLDRAGVPALLVLTADCDLSRVGPDEFPFAARALRWARAVLVHAAGGQEVHYEMAVAGARMHRRLVLVETCTAHLAAWTALALRTVPPSRVLHIAPPPGQVHPVPPPAGGVH